MAVEDVPGAFDKSASDDVCAGRTVSTERLGTIAITLSEDAVKLDGSEVVGKSMMDELVKD